MINYDQLLDEIILNTLSAEKFLWSGEGHRQQLIIPSSLESYSNLFLASSLLLLQPERKNNIIITIPELPEELLLFTGKIWPHFGKARNCKSINKDFDFMTTEESFYPYLDKLFCYLSVINPSKEHRVFFLREGAKHKQLKEFLSQEKESNLIIISDFYNDLPQEIGKNKGLDLSMQLKTLAIDPEISADYPLLELFTVKTDNREPLYHVLNTWELGLNPEKTKTLILYAK